MKSINCFILLICSSLYLRAQPDIAISSSNKELEKAFNWAKAKARSYVLTGKGGPVNRSEKESPPDSVAYIPSYWAGYPLRTAFYSRDFCHQLAGAHWLGLALENFTMMRAFAASSNQSRQHYPLWAINFDGSPYSLDYRDDDDFVREVPAVFELVEKIYQLYLLTGNEDYLWDEVLWSYCTRAVTDFVEQHDKKIPNGVAEGTGTGDIFKGTATYNEQHDIPLLEAGDGIASQYQAYLAYAAMAELRGNAALSATFYAKAKELKQYFNTDWGIKDTDLYNRGYDTLGKPVTGWGKENSWFIPMKGITDDQSPRHDKYLDFIAEKLQSKGGIPANIEAISYVPEIFFQYNRNEEGWKWMWHVISTIDQDHDQAALTGKQGDYPEISFVLVNNVVEGLAGIQPLSGKIIRTASHLPKKVSDLSLSHVKSGSHIISVNHIGNVKTVLRCEQGSEKFHWQAAFAGDFAVLEVNGKEMPAKQHQVAGQLYSYVEIPITVGQTIQVSVVH